MAATHAVTPPGGTVEVKGPAAALAERQGVVPEQIPKEVIPNLTQEQVEQKSPLPESAGTPDPIREAMERARSYTEQAEAATTAAERSRLVDLSFAELDKAEALRRAASAPKKPVTPQIVSLTTPSRATLTPGGERQVENLERKAEVVPFDAVYHAPTERRKPRPTGSTRQPTTQRRSPGEINSPALSPTKASSRQR